MTTKEPTKAELLRALRDARETAMRNTLAARIPECGDFGAIAQNLDWVLNQFESARIESEQLGVPDWRGILEAVMFEVKNVHRFHRDDGNAPGHSHSVPGIWDEDNGAKAGKPCAWCALWSKAKSMLDEQAAAKGKRTNVELNNCSD